MADKLEVWTYMGRRVCGEDEAAHYWRRPGGEEAVFNLRTGRKATGMKGSIGVRYEVTVTDTGFRREGYEGAHEDREEVARWVLEDEIVKAEDTIKKVERAAKKESEGWLGNMTLTEAAQLSARYPRTKRAALEVAILSLIRRGW